VRLNLQNFAQGKGSSEDLSKVREDADRQSSTLVKFTVPSPYATTHRRFIHWSEILDASAHEARASADVQTRNRLVLELSHADELRARLEMAVAEDELRARRIR